MHRKVPLVLSGLSFTLTAAEVLTIVSQESSFLGTAPRTSIPLAMGAGAVAAAVVSVVLARMGRHRSARTVSIIAFVGAALLLFRLGMWPASSALGSFVTYALLDALLFILAATCWSFIQAPLGPLTARETLPKVNLGAGIGALAGGLFVPAWMQLGTTSGLLVVASFMCAACAGIVLYLRRHQVPNIAEGQARGPSLRELIHQPLPVRIALLSGLFIIVRLIVEVEFKAQLQTRYDEAHMTTVLGTLEAVAAFLSLPVSLWLSGPVLARVGRRASLAILPALWVCGLAAFAFLGSFGIMALAIVMKDVLKPTIHNTAQGCLLGGLDRRVRGRFTLMLEGALNPTVAAGGGLVVAQAMVLSGPWIPVFGAAVGVLHVLTTLRLPLSSSKQEDDDDEPLPSSRLLK